MPSKEAFLQAVIENPDDDAPRLIYADWLEEQGESQRAELIRTQCELARLAEDDEVRRPILQEREWTLLSAHAKEWLAELPVLEGIKWDESTPLGKLHSVPDFERGFACSIIAENEKAFQEHTASIFRAAPVNRLGFNHRAKNLDLFLSCPELERLRRLGMSAQFHRRRRNWQKCFAQLVNCPRLAQLRELDLWLNKLGDKGVQILIDSPYLTRLTTLDLGSNDVSMAGMRSLSAWPVHKQLKYINLAGNPIGNVGARELLSWPSLTDLTLSSDDIGPEWVSALVGSPLLSRLRGLSVGGNIGNEGVRLLADCPRPIRLAQLNLSSCNLDFTASAPSLHQAVWLRELNILDLGNNRIASAGARDLADLASLGHLPKLKVLYLEGAEIDDAGVYALADCPLARQLEELNLSGNQFSKKAWSRLRKRIGGRVVKYW